MTYIIRCFSSFTFFFPLSDQKTNRTMTLIEIQSPSALADFIRSKTAVVVTFSAHWCGPCRASKPALESLASQKSSIISMGIIYEDVLGDAIHSLYHIRAFPTHVLFVSGIESQRVEGANIPAIEKMINTYLATAPTNLASMTGGETLGGGTHSTPLSPAEARLARLAKLGGATTATTASETVPAAPSDTDKEEPPKKVDEATPMEKDDENLQQSTTGDIINNTGDDNDVEMEDADKEKDVDEKVMVDPTANLNPEIIETLTESMGFTLLRAQKGLLYGTGGTIEGAIEWLTQHQDDDDIDEPIPLVNESTGIAQSYKCNECGRLFSNMANLELHANKTGHSDFEESTESVKIMTPEEKIAKIAEIKVGAICCAVYIVRCLA
jgi:UBX domain-containing protein 1/4